MTQDRVGGAGFVFQLGRWWSSPAAPGAWASLCDAMLARRSLRLRMSACHSPRPLIQGGDGGIKKIDTRWRRAGGREVNGIPAPRTDGTVPARGSCVAGAYCISGAPNMAVEYVALVVLDSVLAMTILLLWRELRKVRSKLRITHAGVKKMRTEIDLLTSRSVIAGLNLSESADRGSPRPSTDDPEPKFQRTTQTAESEPWAGASPPPSSLSSPLIAAV